MNMIEKENTLHYDETEFFDYLEVIIKRRWLIFWGILICIISVAFFTKIKERVKIYESHASIHPSEQSDYLKTGIDERIVSQQVYPEIMESFTFRESIVKKRYKFINDGKEEEKDLIEYFNSETLENAVLNLNSIIEIETLNQGIIDIKVSTKFPELSASIANEYINQLDIYNQERRNSNAKANLEFIEGRLEQIKKELENAEENLLDFTNKNQELLLSNIEGTPNPRVSRSLPALEMERDRLEREVSLKSDLFITLNSQYELAKIEAQKEIPVITVIDYGKPPNSPVPSKLKRNSLIAAFIGLFISVSLAFTMEYFKKVDAKRKEYILMELRKDKNRIKSILKKHP